MKRYEKLTEEITGSILSGLLQAGDRLPSVRQTSASRGVSPSTVFKAYYLLEARGLIRARDRSGYYVLRAQATLPELEAVSSAAAVRHPVDVSDKVLQVLNATLRRDMLPFGSAFPNPSLLPYGRLAKFMASTVQKLDPWGSIDDLSPGDAALRRAIALRYLADGLTVPVDDIIITNGALDALNLCLSAVTRPGDAVIVESPTFYAALQSLERNQLHAIEVATHPREGIDLDALAQAIVRHKPRACWLMTTFQNPLGSLMPDAKKEALVKLLTPRRGADRGRRLRRTLFRRQAPAPGQGLRPRGIVMHCSSFSKTLAPGYRVGWVAGGRYTRRIMRNKLTTSLATAAPTRPPSPPTWRKAASIATCASSASSWPCNRARCCRPWRGIFPRAPVPRVRRAATSSGSSCPNASTRCNRIAPRWATASASRPVRCSRPPAASATSCG